MRKAIRRGLARLRGIFSRADDSLAREMEAHLEMATEEYIRRGMSPPDARRAAQIEAGSIDAATEAYRDQHGVPIIDAFRRDLRFAFKGLRRNPRFGIGIAASLALGIGFNTAIFTVVDNVMRRPLPFHEPDRLVAVGSIARGSADEMIEWASYPRTIEAWQSARALSALTVVMPYSSVVAGAAAPEYTEGALVTRSFLRVLGVNPARGRGFAENDPNEVVIISNALWRRQFAADTGIVGRTLRMSGRPFTVIGVLPPGVALPLSANFWIPTEDGFGPVIGRLRDGQSIEALDAELTNLSPMQQVYAGRGQTLDVIVMSLHEQLYGSARTALTLLFGAALLFLLITCANVTNLSLARSLERRRELAMRIALGATHRSIGSLLVLENLLLTVAGGVAGLATAWLATASLVSLAPPSVKLDGDIRVRGAQILFAGLIAVAACVLVSLAPVAASMPKHLTRSFAQSTVQSGRGRGLRRVRQTLVAAQIAVTLLLMTGSGLLILSVQRMTRPDHLGFSSEGVVILNVSPFGDSYEAVKARQDFVRRLKQRLAELPGVQRVSSGPPPLVSGTGQLGYREGFDMIFSWSDPGFSPRPRGVPAPGRVTVWAKNVDPSYRETFGITMAAGRWFTSADDSASTRVALVNRTAAKLFFGAQNPIGRPIPSTAVARNGQVPIVIGVVGDVLQRGLTLSANPEVLLAAAQQPPPGRAILAVQAKIPATAMIPAIRRALYTMDPSLAATRLEAMDDVIDNLLARHRFVLRLLTFFASLGLVLAAVGLYGVVSYLVTQRTREIGVRIALGADRRHVLVLVMRESTMLAAIGVVIGIPLTLAGARLLSGFLYEVRIHDAFAFAGGPLILAAVAIAAAWVPARRAAAVDPALTLRVD